MATCSAAGDRHAVLELDGDLSRDVRAAEALVRREPGRRVGVALLTVGARRHGEQVQRVVRERHPLPGAPARRALLPRVAERDDVVDVDARPAAAHVRDRRGRVRVGQRAGRHHAAVGAGPQRLPPQVEMEEVVAGVAAVVVDVDPAAAELVAAVARQRATALHDELRDGCQGRAARGLARGGLGPDRREQGTPRRGRPSLRARRVCRECDASSRK